MMWRKMKIIDKVMGILTLFAAGFIAHGVIVNVLMKYTLSSTMLLAATLLLACAALLLCIGGGLLFFS